jgi:hypothetical protein
VRPYRRVADVVVGESRPKPVPVSRCSNAARSNMWEEQEPSEAAEAASGEWESLDPMVRLKGWEFTFLFLKRITTANRPAVKLGQGP